MIRIDGDIPGAMIPTECVPRCVEKAKRTPFLLDVGENAATFILDRFSH